MSNDAAFERVSSIIGGAMDDAWKKIMRDLAEAARTGKSASLDFGEAGTLSADDIRGFFAVAGGANLGIEFPCMTKRNPIGVFRAAVIRHDVSPVGVGDASAQLIRGEISIGVNIRF